MPHSSEKTPAEVVQEQVDAYNARDIEAFLATYAEDIEVFDHPDTLTMSGHVQMREIYTGLFDRIPDLNAAITNRITIGKFVIDQEKVTGLPGNRTLDAVAIYEVDDCKIRRVWFVKDS